ncbi:MAG TPA: DUF262 domain-containing protein [Clostridiales bacterium]|nr:DUF262 domain-containing protein [Clostridiales bacterium]
MSNVNLLETEILETRNSLSTDRLDMSFGEIMSVYERDEIIISPDFQRLFRWSEGQKTRFIESLLLGIPIPPIFVAEDNNGKWELVDGLQRLSTVLSFFGLLRNIENIKDNKNNWALCEGELIKSLELYTCAELPLKFQLNIKRSSCRVEIIKWNSKIDMRYELFNRLNTGGSPLTDQEIRNCIFRGISTDFNEFLKRIADNEDFKCLIGPTEKQLSELYLQELVLRFMSLFNNWENVNHILSKHMTEYMRTVIRENSFDYSLESVFLRIINLLKPLGKEIFRFEGTVFSTSLFDAITIGIGLNLDYYEQNIEVLKAKITELKTNPEFKRYTGSASNNKSRVINRIKIANTIFKVV